MGNKWLNICIVVASVLAIFFIALLVVGIVGRAKVNSPQEPEVILNTVKVYDVNYNCKEFQYINGDVVDDELMSYYENRSIANGGTISLNKVITFYNEVFEIYLSEIKFD